MLKQMGLTVLFRIWQISIIRTGSCVWQFVGLLMSSLHKWNRRIPTI